MDRELLVKLLRNDLTEEEARLVKEWLDLSEQNRQYYAAFQLMWEKKKKLPVDVERNYTELFHKRKNVKRNIYAWHWRAAVIVLLLGTSLYISKYYINRQAEQERPVAGLETEAVLHTGDKETFVICKKEERQLIRHEGMIIERRNKTLNYNVLQDSLTQKSELRGIFGRIGRRIENMGECGIKFGVSGSFCRKGTTCKIEWGSLFSGS